MATKKITLNSITGEIPDVETVEVVLDNGATLSVKKQLDLKDAMGFVTDIVSSCTDDETAEYTPEAFEFAMRMCTVRRYAGVEFPKDISKSYRALYGSDLFDKVYDAIDVPQHESLILAAYRRIDYWCRVMESMAAIKVSELLSKIDELMVNNTNLLEAFDQDGLRDMMESLVSLTSGQQAPASLPMHEQDQNEEVLAEDAGEQLPVPADDGIIYLPKK